MSPSAKPSPSFIPCADAITESSLWRAPFGSAVVPDEKYTHLQSADDVGGGDRVDGSPAGSRSSEGTGPSKSRASTLRPKSLAMEAWANPLHDATVMNSSVSTALVISATSHSRRIGMMGF